MTGGLRCLVCGEPTHRPSAVLELPPDRWLYCLLCSMRWPCAAADHPAHPDQPETTEATP